MIPGTPEYVQAHRNVRYALGEPTVCVECGATENLEWSNISGNYEDVMDFEMLCKGCHRRKDVRRLRPLCPQGHSYDYTDEAGHRRCSICKRASRRRYYRKQKATNYAHLREVNRCAQRKYAAKKKEAQNE